MVAGDRKSPLTSEFVDCQWSRIEVTDGTEGRAGDAGGLRGTAEGLRVGGGVQHRVRWSREGGGAVTSCYVTQSRSRVL